MTMPSPNPASPVGDPIARAAGRTAAVAGVYCIVVLALLLANAVASLTADPLRAHRLTAMQVELNRTPRNETLRQDLRRLDHAIRIEYFRGRAFAVRGAFLLAGGVAVFLLALEIARRRRGTAPVPRPDAPDQAWADSLVARRSVTVLAVGLGATLLVLVVLGRHDLSAEYARQADAGWAMPRRAQAVTGAAVPVVTAPPPGAIAGGLPPLAGPGVAAGAVPAALPGPATPVGGLLSPGGTTLQPLPVPAPAAGAAATPRPGPAALAGAPVALAPIVMAGAEREWPQFRGPGGTGEATGAAPPVEWDGASGRGVVWKTAVPLPGHGSPIVWGDRVFVAGADRTRREIYCFSASDGRLLWRRAVPPRQGGGEVRVFSGSTHAPATMVTNGRMAFAIFVDGVIAGVDMNGTLVWTRDLGPLDNNYGHASSLVMYGNGVIVQLDQGMAPEDGRSRLLALDAATGNTVWEVARPVSSSWSTPVLVRAGARELLITAAKPLVIAYDPRSGTEVWRAEVLGGEVAPAPTFGSGLVYAVNLGANLAAIRPDGSGNVTGTHIAWLGQENLPDIVSPLYSEGLLFLCTSDGTITCFDARTGTKLWEHHLDKPVSSSPVVAQRRVYLTDTEGRTIVFEVAREFRRLAANSLGEPVHATPAVVGERIFMRGERHLFCLGK